MIVDELILKLQADLGDIKKSLKQVEADAAKSGKEAGAKMGKEAGTSFGDVFNAIAGAAVLNTVKGFFSKAAAEFNKMEAAMMRVDSIAKGFGRSVEVAKKQVNELADKGFLNLNQAASSYADAIALGFDEKQARKFIDSLSDIAAFQNTIGNGAEAVQSGLAGLLSNSAEKVENIGVPVKVLNQEYQKNIATMGKAAALQKFYNGILKESDKFQGDAARSVDTLAGAQNKYNAAVDKAQVAIGKGLEPTLKGLYAIGQKLAEGFANWFGSLDATTKTMVLAIPAVGAFVLALGTVLPVLKMIAVSNPFGWLTLAISGVLALAAAANEYASKAKPENIVKAYKEQKDQIESLGEKQKSLSAINIRTIDQELELLKTKEALRDKAKALGLDYDELAKKAKNLTEVTLILTNAEREAAAARIDKEREAAAADIRAYEAKYKATGERVDTKLDIAGEVLSALPGGVAGQGLKRYAQTSERLGEAKARLARADLERAKLYSEDGNITKKQEAQLAASGAVETRFLDAQNKLKEIEKNLAFTISIAKRLKDPEERKRRIDAAEEDAKQQVEAEFTARRQSYAEFIENKYMADTEALNKSTDDAIRASNEILEAELKNKNLNESEILDLQADNEIRIQKIREANAKKQAEINAQSFVDTINAATSIATIARATQSKDAAGLLSGAGGGLSALSKNESIKALNIPGMSTLGTLGVVGAAIGGLGAVIGGLFDSSDNKREREAAKAQQQREEAKKLLEIQNEYTKSQLELQRAAAETPFKNLEKELRLITLKSQTAQLNGTDRTTAEAAARSESLAAIAATVSSEGGTIAQGQLFGDVQSTASGLTQFLKERQTQATAVSQFMGLIEAIGSNSLSPGQYWAINAQLKSYKGLIPDALYNSVFNASGEAAYGGVSQGVDADGNVSSVFLGNVGQIKAARGLASEIGIDTSRAEQLLSLFERQNGLLLETADNTKKTAENTSKALELRPDRERSFIDVGLGFMQSLGQRITSPSGRSIAASLSQQNFSIPAEIGSASVTSSRARTLQERMADALEMQLMQGATANDILRDIRALTYDLLAVMDGDASTGASFSQQDFINFSSDVKRRRI